MPTEVSIPREELLTALESVARASTTPREFKHLSRATLEIIRAVLRAQLDSRPPVRLEPTYLEREGSIVSTDRLRDHQLSLRELVTNPTLPAWLFPIVMTAREICDEELVRRLGPEAPRPNILNGE